MFDGCRLQAICARPEPRPENAESWNGSGSSSRAKKTNCSGSSCSGSGSKSECCNMNLTESEPAEQLRSGRGSLQGSGSSSAPDAHRTHRDARSGRALIPATFCQHRGRPAAARSHASDRGTRSGSGKDSGHRYPPPTFRKQAQGMRNGGERLLHTQGIF